MLTRNDDHRSQGGRERAVTTNTTHQEDIKEDWVEHIKNVNVIVTQTVYQLIDTDAFVGYH